MLTNSEIVEFKKLVSEICGVTLSDEQAEDQGSRLILLFELLMKANTQLANKAINLNKKVPK